MRSIVLVCLVCLQTFSVRALAENTTKEFIMSCTYGVFAGTLVGAASLAFSSRPGHNLNAVARGASLGLYTGILLGFYVVYVVPGLDKGDDGDPVARNPNFRLNLGPTLSQRGAIDGLHASYDVLRF